MKLSEPMCKLMLGAMAFVGLYMFAGACNTAGYLRGVKTRDKEWQNAIDEAFDKKESHV